MTEHIKVILTNHRWTAVFLTILLLVLLHMPLQAYDFLVCNDCHEDTLGRDAARIYPHSPFNERECGECHTAQPAISSQIEAPAKVSTAKLEDQRKITWLGDSAMTDTNHGFLLPGDKVGNTLVVELHGTGGKFSGKEIVVPSLADLTEVEDSGKPPVISELQVLEVQRGVFLSVTIGWQTDTLTDALVRYGDQDLSQMSEPSKRFGRYHQVVLYNLKVDQTYRFSVVSTDLFGRSQISEPLTFSTSKPFTATQPDNPDILQKSGEESGITSHFQRLGSDYLLELTLEQPALVFIGSRGAARNQNEPDVSISGMAADEESHAGLSSEIVISMEACRNCHQFHRSASHPVNVYAKPGMTIPPEYPTLPDGRITCSSCHTPHSSDYEYLVRKRGKRELCVGCHQNML